MYGFEDFITMRHLENMAKVMLVTGLIVVYGYMIGSVLRLVQRQPVREVHDPQPHDSGRTRWSYWMLIFCNVIVPQMLWIKTLRTNTLCCSSCRWS